MQNKIFAYTVLTLNVIAAWASWWVLAAAIYGKTEHTWLYPILTFSFWGIVFTLAVIFVKSKKYFYASVAAGAVVYPLFFGFSLSIFGMIAAFFLLALTENQTKKRIERGIKINFYNLVSYSLKYFVTAICLVIAVAYYFSITDRLESPALTIETKTLEAEIDWGLKAAGLVLSDEKKMMIEDIINGMTVDNFLSKNFVKPEIEENMAIVNNIMPDSPSDATKLIGDAAAVKIQEEMLAKSKRDLAKQLGVDVVGERPMKEVLMAYIDKTEREFFEYSGTDKFYVPVILAFGIFLTARILGTAVDIFLGLFILGIIKILRILGIVNINKEQREVGVIEYSI